MQAMSMNPALYYFTCGYATDQEFGGVKMLASHLKFHINLNHIKIIFELWYKL
jgi:hypothetical protein